MGECVGLHDRIRVPTFWRISTTIYDTNHHKIRTLTSLAPKNGRKSMSNIIKNIGFLCKCCLDN